MPLSSHVPLPVPRDRLALRVVQLGTIAVVLAAAPYKTYDLDRFFVPKELALHACAVIAAVVVLTHCRRVALTAVDALLVAFLVLSALSALFATNWWLAGRALAISCSGILLYWVGARLRREGLARGVLVAAIAAAVLGTVTALVQAYVGPATDYFSLNRAPGGAFGNRNFMAHLAAIVAPVTILMTLTARRRLGVVAGFVATMVLSAGLVLSRTRGAWLALLVALCVVAGAAMLTRARISDAPIWRRLVAVGVMAAIGTMAAILLPNRLEWKSASPYLDSVRDVVDYREGSGHGRVIQYSRTLSLIMAHPILGVGPGNWAVAYPAVALRNDPSIAVEEGMTDNPWPSSDWIAFASERGVIATVCLGVALLMLLARAMANLRESRERDDGGTDAVYSLALVGTIVATVVVGAFDAVLLIAVPAMFMWLLAGALAPPVDGRTTRGVPAIVPIGVAVLGAIAIGRSALQLAAMSVTSSSTKLAAIEQGARLDPGNYRIQLHAAQVLVARHDCVRARPYERAARALYPSAAEAKRLVNCEDKRQ